MLLFVFRLNNIKTCDVVVTLTQADVVIWCSLRMTFGKPFIHLEQAICKQKIAVVKSGPYIRL